MTNIKLAYIVSFMARKIDPDDYLTPMQAATMLGCSLATVYNYMAQGKLKKRSVLRQTLLLKKDVAKFKEGLKS